MGLVRLMFFGVFLLWWFGARIHTIDASGTNASAKVPFYFRAHNLFQQGESVTILIQYD